MVNPKKYITKPYVKFRKLFRKKKKAPGSPPGTLVFTGEKKRDKVIINLIDYKGNVVNERIINDPGECIQCNEPDTISWIDVEGLHDVPLIQKLGESLKLHPLVMEDILNVEQRSKMEEYDNYVYIVLKMFHIHKDSMEIIPEQVSIILSKNYVVTFQEGIEGDTFHEVRERIRNNKGVITKMTSDYLVYTLIDSIIDSYFTMLEMLGEKIEDLEEELINNPEKSTLTKIYTLKREMLYLRKTVWPLREAISRLERGESELITRNTHIYLRDVYDHTINVLDTLETYRDMLSGMLDIYLSSISNKLNETMKYLALISTIFIPMTFIASIYGMNFDFIPELHWPHGYWFAMGLMLTVGLGFLIYFKKKKWV
ncbi:MAG TPA: magnesium/cobalt transporter CorA [Ignavibacteria bacterium]|jgi:magnesium transporter